MAAVWMWLEIFIYGTMLTMTTLLLQYTSIRTSLVGGKPFIGLKHTAKGAADLPVSTVWIDMPPDDVRRLIKSLQETLAELDQS